MVFDKKRVFLYSSILVLLLIGVYFANGIAFISRTPMFSTGFIATTNSTATALGHDGVNYTEQANWTKGGQNELINFTLTMTSDAMNISYINITMPLGYQNITTGFVTNTSNQFGQNGKNWTLVNLNSFGLNGIVSFKAVNASSAGGIAGSTNGSGNGNLSSGMNISLWFNAIAINSTETVYNWTFIVGNSSTSDNGFGTSLGVDGLAPRLNTTLGHNATDGTNTKTTLTSTQYLQSNPTSDGQGINITVTFNDYNIDRVLLVYNSTGGNLNLTLIRNSLHQVNFTRGQAFNLSGENVTFNVLEFYQGAKTNTTTLLTRGSFDSDFPPAYTFSFNISNNTWSSNTTSDGQKFKYVFVVHDLFNNSEIINNSNAEFIIGRDQNNPSVTLTAPTDTTIDVYASIKYTCDGADTSGLASCTTTLTKPNGDTVTKTGCSNEQTFTTTETNGVGTNTVKCEVKDNVGRTASTSGTFTVSASTGIGSGGSGGGDSGGGSGGSGSSADNPVIVSEGVTTELGTLTTADTYTNIAESGTLSFTALGETHTAKVLTITSDSVTVEISSTPKQITLNVGDTKEVDVNDNGKSDLSVTLKSISNAKADLVFKVIEENVETGGGDTGGSGEEEITGEPTESSSTWLWILLVVVVVVLLVWYFSKKK